jgi:hypothetical protein
MKECAERVVKVGFTKDPKDVFDEVERISAEMIKMGWHLSDSCIEDGLGCIHLFFEREVAES